MSKRHYLLAFMSLFLLAGCGEEKQHTVAQNPPIPVPATIHVTASDPDPFPDGLLTEFSSWNPVSPTNQAFVSKGHDKMFAKAYFNDIAKVVYEGTGPYSFPEGSFIAKAMLMAKDDPVTAAPKIFFMRKMPSGYDSDNNDWAYGAAMMNGGKYQWTAKGKVDMCIQCHQNEQDYDFVVTAKLYRDHAVP